MARVTRVGILAIAIVPVFGPYGAIWMSKLKADAKNKRLTDIDCGHYDRLRKKYPELMRER